MELTKDSSSQGTEDGREERRHRGVCVCVCVVICELLWLEVQGV